MEQRAFEQLIESLNGQQWDSPEFVLDLYPDLKATEPQSIDIANTIGQKKNVFSRLVRIVCYWFQLDVKK